jgi:ABC-2 type transport system ATP-binding protein
MIPSTDQLVLIKDLDGHAEIAIDTAVISVSEAIATISEKVDIKDISVIGESIDETVVSLYKEFEI